MRDAGALWMPSENFFLGRRGHRARFVIIHGTAGFESAEAVGRFFQTADVATHYTVGRDATVICSVDEDNGAWGNGFVSGVPGVAGDGVHHDVWWGKELNPNLVTISIEHVKPSRDNSDELTEVQKRASFELVRGICRRHGIPGRWADAEGGITGHFSMDPVNRSFCPGPYPWEELFEYLQGHQGVD